MSSIIKRWKDGSNWKIKYEGVADNASVSDLNNQKASDWQSWQPTSSDTPVATGKNITYDDGFVTPETFDIYEFKTGEFLAYKVEGQFGYVVDLVVLNADGKTWNNKRPDDQFKFKTDDTILLGRESAGVPEKIHKLIKKRLKIPMNNQVRSLNIATSVAIVLAESLRQIELI